MKLIVLIVKRQVLVAHSIMFLGQLSIAFFDYIKLFLQGKFLVTFILQSLLENFDLFAIGHFLSRAFRFLTAGALTDDRG